MNYRLSTRSSGPETKKKNKQTINNNKNPKNKKNKTKPN